MNISATSWPITTKFYLKHYLGGEKAAIGFGPDWTRTLGSMATDRSYRGILGKSCGHSSAFIFDWIVFILVGNKDNHNISDEFECKPDLIMDCGVICP